MKLLIDTNVVIGLEDAQPVQASLAELVRLSNAHSVGLFVDGATYDDVDRDRNSERRAITTSKLAKFQKLRNVPHSDPTALASRFGPSNNENDLSDARLLAALDAKAVDFLVTQDIRLHRRAERAGLAGSVLTVEEVLEWLKQSFATKAVHLPYIFERKAYELNRSDPIFDGLRADYDGFDIWFDKCRTEHRDCWVLEFDQQIAGLVIRKDEAHNEAGTEGRGPKIMKICTFKVRDEFQGEKFGELLLKQVLWFAQANKYDLAYVTAFPKHAFLTDLLSYYGFRQTKVLANGELMLEKRFLNGPLPSLQGSAFDFDREFYPRFHDGPSTRKFCVPIQPDYHRRLFPEIAFQVALPLFPTETFGPLLAEGQTRIPGNTIRKVYLCRAKITRLRAGDLIFFYMSKDDRWAASQSVTTVGVVGRVVNITSTDELLKQTAKRSVFSAETLDNMRASTSSPVKMIEFLLIGHLQSRVKLDTLVQKGIFSKRPPQSIAELDPSRYGNLKAALRLGFDI